MSEQLAAARQFLSKAEEFRAFATEAVDPRTSRALIAVAQGYEAMAGTMEAIDVALKAIGWPNVLKPTLAAV